jgi:hypothetical protein
MTLTALNLPFDIPWKLIATSPDMMDMSFCDKTFPRPWRSSLAIYVYEPTPDDLPLDVVSNCDQITYLKVTCSITGYQPSKEETDAGYTEFSDVPTDVLDKIFATYFACYGVLLNVAVFPTTKTILKGPPVHNVDGFASLAGPVASPYTDAQGVIFALAQGANLQVKQVPPTGPQAVSISRDKMTITMPAGSTNVVLKLFVANPYAKGTVTAFRNGTQVFSAPLPTATAGVQDLPILTNSPITTVVIDITNEECLLAGLTYDTQTQQPLTLGDYPHIVDFEPKTRDLYQATTDTGELLSASHSQVNTGKAFTNTSSSETGINLNTKYTSPMTPYGQAEVGGSLQDKWGQSSTDSTTIQGDTSRDRREMQGTSTNISQMYNLLTGYHAGTNRAVFLILPRPHTLQATDHRTFINGLRIIEGVQEFFLVVPRPKTMPGLCIEAWLETGHFPEDVTVSVPPPVYDTGSETFTVTADAGGGNISSNTTKIESDPSSTHNLESGWVIDRQNAGSDAGHPGITVVADNSYGARDGNGNFNVDPQPHANYQPSGDATVQVSGKIWSNGGWGAGAHYNVTFKVFTRSEQPQSNPDGSGPTVTTPALITARGLCVCYASGDPCPVVTQVGDPTASPVNGNTGLIKGVSIIYEPQVPIDTTLLSSVSRLPAMKALLSKMQSILSTNWRLPGRYTPGTVGFLDSDYLKNQIQAAIPGAALTRPATSLGTFTETSAAAFGASTTVGDALKMNLRAFSNRAGLSIQDAASARRKLLKAAFAASKKT